MNKNICEFNLVEYLSDSDSQNSDSEDSDFDECLHH